MSKAKSEILPKPFHALQLRGLNKLGTLHFPDFMRHRAARGLDALAATLSAAEHRELHLLLWAAALLPRFVIRLLFKTEDEARTLPLRHHLTPLHIQIKGLCALLYFHAIPNPDRLPSKSETPMTDFDLHTVVSEFSSQHDLTETYAKVLNNQAVKYTNALGYEGVEFVDCEPHHLIDRDGTRYLDFIAGFATQHWGRKHPVITAAMQQAAAAPWPNLLQLGVPTLSTILAQKLTALAGDGFDRVFFTNAGAETTDYAIKMSVVATGRQKMLYLKGDYHGLTLSALSVNGVTKQQKLFHVDGANLQLPFDHIEALRTAFADHGKEIAGLIIEPVQARYGLIASDEYLTVARALCDKHGAMLIMDEIKSGFGRTGRNFFFEWTPVRPDILMLAKGLSAGAAPVGALLYSEKLHKKIFKDVERLAVFSSTFRENNYSMAAGLAVMHLMEHESPLENVLAAEARLRARLDGYELPNGERIEVLGKGLQLSVCVAGRGKSLARAAIDVVEKDLFYTLCCERLMSEHRIVSMIPNRFGEAIAVIPALNIPLELVDEFCDGIIETFGYFTGKSSMSFLGNVVKSARKLL